MRKDVNKYEKWSYNQCSFYNQAEWGNRTEKMKQTEPEVT